MIINNRSVSLYEAANIMQMSEEEVFKLTQYGYLQAARPIQGRTMVSLHSIDAYARRNQITLQEAPKLSVGRSGSLTVQNVMNKLGLETETAVHRLIQAGKLKAQMEKGIYKVDAGSVRDYVLGA
ncbi:Helix-turn-helix domain protein [compost metagenome]